MAYIISQILVCIADIFYVSAMLTKKRSGLLFGLIMSDILFGTHYFLLNAHTGAMILMADIAFLCIMFVLNKHGKQQSYWYISLIFAVTTVIITIFTWNTAISLLPMFGMVTYFCGMGFSKLYISKSGGAVRNLCNIIYMVLITSYVGAALEFLLLISAIVGIIETIKLNKKKI